jgi:hypothetical protein
MLPSGLMLCLRATVPSPSRERDPRLEHSHPGYVSRERQTERSLKTSSRCLRGWWSQGMESNHRYTVLQTAALTTWLPWAASTARTRQAVRIRARYNLSGA